MTRAPITRRRALSLIAVGTAGVAVGTTGWITSLGGPADSGGRLKPGASGHLLAEPAVLASRDGVLDVALTAAAGARLAGRHTSALGYNATSPGPTLRVAPGDLLRIRLTNHLDVPTNLHTTAYTSPRKATGTTRSSASLPVRRSTTPTAFRLTTRPAPTGITHTTTATSPTNSSAASREHCWSITAPSCRSPVTGSCWPPTPPSTPPAASSPSARWTR